MSHPAPDALAPALLDWWETHGRHDLPWQHDPTPYRVWVSEVMLQQTQVTTVLGYYDVFLARFPDVAALAAAPLDAVLHAWTGLGYYARARHLHDAARLIVERHGGEMPDDLETLRALPGIGRSTAGAILALSRSRCHPILDANARRVLCRYLALDGVPGDPTFDARLWAAAEACTPTDCVAEYTQAIMDLGATVCIRSRPRCEDCPLTARCIAYVTQRQDALPQRRRRSAQPVRTAYAAVIRNKRGELLLQRQPAPGIWGGLWSFPSFQTEEALSCWLQGESTTRTSLLQALASQRHVFTHFELDLRLVATTMDADYAPAGEDLLWYAPASARRIGLSKAVLDLLPRLSLD